MEIEGVARMAGWDWAAKFVVQAVNNGQRFRSDTLDVMVSDDKGSISRCSLL